MKNKFVDDFLDFEEKYDLFNREFNNFKYWEFIRMRVYATVFNHYLGLLPIFDKEINAQKFNVKHINKYFYFNKLSKKDILFSSHPRRMQYENKYICKCTDSIINQIKQTYSYMIIEEPYYSEIKSAQVDHYTPIPNNDIIYTDYLEFLFGLKKKIYIILNKKKYIKLVKELHEVINLINSTYKIDITYLLNKFINNILYIILMQKKYEKILTKISPKLLVMFFYPSVQKLLLIKVSKQLGIPVVDVQHGIMTDEDPIFYHFKVKREYKSVADYFFGYSKILNSEKNLPYVDEIEKHMIYVGNIFLEENLKKYKNVNKDKEKRYILIISQPTLGQVFNEFVKQLSELLKNNKEYEILIKLHPYENGVNYEDINFKSNVKILDKTENVYLYQNISFAQVGIYSTALYEGIAFELPTFIIDNVFGSEISKNVIPENTNVIYYINNAQEMFSIIKNGMVQKPQKEFIDKLWSKNVIYNVITNVEKILHKN